MIEALYLLVLSYVFGAVSEWCGRNSDELQSMGVDSGKPAVGHMVFRILAIIAFIWSIVLAVPQLV